jgi:hypothetical protein
VYVWLGPGDWHLRILDEGAAASNRSGDARKMTKEYWTYDYMQKMDRKGHLDADGEEALESSRAWKMQ